MVQKVSDSFKKHIPGFIIGPLIKIIEAVFDLLMPLIMKAVIDLYYYGSPENISNPLSQALAYFIRAFGFEASPLVDALVGGGIILVMGIVGYSITMVAQYIAARVSVDVGTEIRYSLFDKILRLSKKEREEITSSKLLTIINSDSYQLQKGVLLFTRLIVRAPFILLGSLVFSFILDWRVGLAFLVIVPLIVLVNLLVLRKSSKAYIEIQKELDDLSSKTSETIEGGRVIRASNSEALENTKFSTETNEYKERAMKVNTYNSFINPLTFAITSIVLIVIILLLRNELFDPNQNSLISSTIVAEMAYLSQIFFVTVQLTQAIIELVKAYVSGTRINTILKINPAIKDGNYNGDKKENEGALLRFNDVSFSFLNNENHFLDKLNFEIRKGETFGIIGGTGSGKSTIISLIERFYDVKEGEILYQGINIKDYPLSSLRHDIALVNQKSSLFKGTIKSNMLMANPNAKDEDIIEALKEAEAYEFVSKYEDGINHEVLEGGSNFSGGQRQRLCIARALIKKAPILILDDATSALDLLTDKRIRKHISSFIDMTKIIVSQRVSTIQNASYILVLEGGKVVGLGKHETLLKECPIYQEIYETQIKKE